MDRRVYDNYVFQIIEQGNLSKAAAFLGISQPAISSGLTALENELGIKIFNRKTNPITLTPEGGLYYDYLKRARVLEEDLWQRVENCRAEANSKAIIGGPVAYVESIVTDAVMQLKKENPDYKVDIKCSPLSELIDMSSKGEINCFISTSEDIPVSFEKILVKQEKIYLCVPKENPINKQISEYTVEVGQTGETFDYSIFNDLSFIFLEKDQPMQKQMEAFFKKNNIKPQNTITVNQVSTAVNLVLKGEGACFASEGSLNGKRDLSSICIYPLPDTISGRKIYIAYNKELFMPDACKKLMEYLV